MKAYAAELGTSISSSTFGESCINFIVDNELYEILTVYVERAIVVGNYLSIIAEFPDELVNITVQLKYIQQNKLDEILTICN